MVASFSTAENKFSFEIDGKPYMLGALTFGDIDTVTGYAALPNEEKVEFVKALISSRADKRTLAAINSLSINQVASLFTQWAGMTPGESAASPK